VQFRLRCAADGLDLLRVAVKHLQDRKRLPVADEHFAHRQSGKHGHCRVEPDVVAAAERYGIGQSGRRGEFFKVGRADQDFLSEQRLQLVRGRASHQFDERLVFTQRNCVGTLFGKGRREPQVIRQRHSNSGGQHAFADIS
jgi:hypothetical protein